MALSEPTLEALRELSEWTPRHGVISVYLEVDPADRGEGWRIELRNGLNRVVENARRDHDRATRGAVEATAARIAERFPPDAPHPGRRSQIGFVAVGDKAAGERWFAVQLPCRTEVVHDRNAHLVPLVAKLDEGRSRAVALVSNEQVRLLRWTLGRLDELAVWELETLELAWRERKAQRSADPARVQGAKASGRDQFDQRLTANRERFLHEAGKLAAERTASEGIAELLAVGEAQPVSEFAKGAAGQREARTLEHRNLASAPHQEVIDRVTELVLGLNRDRERELVAEVVGEGRGGTRAALGPQETLKALIQGRVEHLVLDPGHDFADAAVAVDGEEAGDQASIPERMIELALRTSAAVTPVQGDAARGLDEADGVAALLRY